MPLPISKAEAARQGGRTRGAVTLATREGGALFSAMLPDGQLDASHPAFKAWLNGEPPPDRAPTKASKASAQAASAPTKPRPESVKGPPERTAQRPEKDPPPALVPAPASLKELEEIQALLKPLLDRFGTSRHFQEWLGALKDIEVILEKHLRNEQAQGALISRALVQAHVFGALQGLARKLLQDSPKTIARRLAAHFNAKGAIEDAERIVRENIGSQLEPVKEKAKRVLREPDSLN